MRVFVKNMRGEPLMPCSKRKARLLLKEGKAKIIDYKPFTIQLLSPTGESTQDVHVGVDTGAKHIGIAITSDDKVLAKGEIELRDDIHKNVNARALYRRSRRNRKTRYRKSRFLNRKRSQGWLPPTVQSKLDATFRWIDKFCELVPNPILHIEVGKFDIKKMLDETIYDDNDCLKYYNLRYFIFARDEYTCQVCKKKNKILRIHHILYKSHGGTDRASNLITVCNDCHTSENHKKGGILHNWMIKQKKVKQYKEATFMNIVKKRIQERYFDSIITYGYETSPYRKSLSLEKTHYNDAIAISKIKNIKENPCEWFYIKQFRKKKRSLHDAHPIKGRKHKNTNAKRHNKNVPYRFGWYMNDMVLFDGQIGWIYGFSGGERGKNCIVRNMDNEIIHDTSKKISPSINSKKLKLLSHNNNWQYKMIS